MKRFIKWIFVILLLCSFLFIPFGVKAIPKGCRYVVCAELTLYQGMRQQTKVYSQPQKINSLLNFLRRTEPRGNVRSAPSDPDSHHYRIDLFYSDGSHNTYHLQDYRYFRKNSGLWQKISTTHAQLLYPLLQLLPQDA